MMFIILLIDDVHYGWIDERLCKIHYDLLVAGNLITNKHK